MAQKGVDCRHMEDKKQFETVLERAIKDAKKSKTEITVIHAPIENAEIEIKYGYCPTLALPIMYKFALKGMGQENEPCKGIVAIVGKSGNVFKTESGLKIV
jgi:hypothetical protein